MTILIFQGGAGPNKSSVAGTSILSPGPNIILLLGIGFIVGQKTGLMYQNPILYMFYISLLGAKATHKLVVANLTKASLRVADPYLWSVCSIGFNQVRSEHENISFVSEVALGLDFLGLGILCRGFGIFIPAILDFYPGGRGFLSPGIGDFYPGDWGFFKI